MVSRNRLISEKIEFDNSSSYDDSDVSDYTENKKFKLESLENAYNCRRKGENAFDDYERLPTRQPKCFTKNAVMARQNRLRKKKYVQDLESQVNKLKHANKSLSSILDNQSSIITQLRKELKYMKSVLANSTDISKLLKTINYNTGMSVSTSLDKSLTLKNDCFSKSEPIWPDMNADDCFLSSDISNTELGLLFDNSELFINPSEMTTSHNAKPELSEEIHSNITLKEHNYTVTAGSDTEEVGVCLHVSKHRVSLEFCSTCSENAIETWNELK